MKPDTLSHDAKALSFGITRAIAQIAYRALVSMHRRRRARNAVGHLEDLNEHLLVDIGLPRELLRRMTRERRAETWRFL